MLTIFDYSLTALAAVGAGAVNALAGGGTLITFPVLTALGIPAVVANVTNTIALCPGYLGATFAQMKELKTQRKRLWFIVPTAVVGGIAGGILLLNTGEKIFRQLVPVLILLASLLLAVQEPIKKWVTKRKDQTEPKEANQFWTIILLFPAAVYGGYFGAGVSVIVLAVLGFIYNESLTKLNALKQSVSFSINMAAAIFFLFSGKVDWLVALVMAVGALIGGVLGGKLAGKIKPSTLRWTVVSIGIVVAMIYFIRLIINI